MIVSFIVFGLMMHLIVVPMQEEMKGEIEGVRLNNSQFMETQGEMREIMNKNKKLQEEINVIKLNLGDWNCTKYKKYFDYDCIAITKNKNSKLLKDETCFTLYGFEKINEDITIPQYNLTILPEVCEEWEYVKKEISKYGYYITLNRTN